MGIYEAISFLKKHPTLLEVCPHHCNGTVYYLSNSHKFEYKIRINNNLSIDNRIKTLIHECLHFSPEFRSYLGKALCYSHPVERKIDKLSDDIFNCQPILSKFLEDKIRFLEIKL